MREGQHSCWDTGKGSREARFNVSLAGILVSEASIEKCKMGPCLFEYWLWGVFFFLLLVDMVGLGKSVFFSSFFWLGLFSCCFGVVLFGGNILLPLEVPLEADLCFLSMTGTQEWCVLFLPVVFYPECCDLYLPAVLYLEYYDMC